MIALVVDTDSRSRDVLSGLLRSTGFTSVQAASGLDQAWEFVMRFQGKLSLILSSWDPYSESDFPLARRLLEQRQLDPAPLILVHQDSGILPERGQVSLTSRVDALIRLPFGAPGLLKAIEKGHERRARLRDSILVVGERLGESIRQGVYLSVGSSHWREVIAVPTARQMRGFLDQYGFQVGAVLFDAEDPAALGERDCVTRFKSTSIGIGTPVGIVSGDRPRPETVPAWLRKGADFGLQAPVPPGEPRWESFLSRLSRQSQCFWSTRRLIRESRDFTALGRHWQAARRLREAELREPEALGLAVARGDAFLARGKSQAGAWFERALEENPWSLHARSGLLRSLRPEDRPATLAEALRWCPRGRGLLGAEAPPT